MRFQNCMRSLLGPRRHHCQPFVEPGFPGAPLDRPGATWTRVSRLGHANPEIHGDPIDSKLTYAYHASTGRVYASLDAGATFP